MDSYVIIAHRFWNRSGEGNGGKPATEKGLAEALIVFNFISKHYNDLKPVMTGHISKNSLPMLKRFL